MIVIETVTINGNEFKHTFSDSNYYIQKEGTDEVYAEAFDAVPSEFTYTETNKQIPIDTKSALKLTRGDVFRGLVQAKGITRTQIRALFDALPDETPQEKLQKELSLIDFDEALYFYRKNPLIDKIGAKLGITNYQMTEFFKTNDWHKLVD